MADQRNDEFEDTCAHGDPEGRCLSCAACAACRGECGRCPYVGTRPEKTAEADR